VSPFPPPIVRTAVYCPTASRWMTQGACVTVRVNWQPSPCWICKVALSALEDKERPSESQLLYGVAARRPITDICILLVLLLLPLYKIRDK
jgi:hypothetical protein